MSRVPVRSLMLLPAVALLLFSACASSSAAHVHATTPTTAPPATVLPTATPPTCQSSVLAAVLAGAGVGMGHALAYVWVLNRQVSPCTLVGYATVQLLDGQQRPLPTQEQQATAAYLFSNLQPQLVVLAGRGGRAVFLLQWNDAPINSAQTCPTAAYLRVMLPETQAALITAAEIAPCGGDVITSPLVAASAIPAAPA